MWTWFLIPHASAVHMKMTPACRHFTNRSQAEERKDTPKPEEAEEKPVDPKNHEGEEPGLTKEDI